MASNKVPPSPPPRVPALVRPTVGALARPAVGALLLALSTGACGDDDGTGTSAGDGSTTELPPMPNPTTDDGTTFVPPMPPPMPDPSTDDGTTAVPPMPPPMPDPTTGIETDDDTAGSTSRGTDGTTGEGSSDDAIPPMPPPMPDP